MTSAPWSFVRSHTRRPLALHLHVLAASAFAGAALVAAGLAISHAQDASTRAGLLLANARAEHASRGRDPAHADFRTALPSARQARAFAARLGSTSGSLKLRSVSVRHTIAAPGDVGRTIIDVSLEGPYAAVKDWLRVLLQEWSALAVQSLAMHSSAGAVNAQVSLVLHTAD